jgi:hypothetical protein
MERISGGVRTQATTLWRTCHGKGGKGSSSMGFLIMRWDILTVILDTAYLDCSFYTSNLLMVLVAVCLVTLVF